jgi:mono/diheme cytochrome c family protein
MPQPPPRGVAACSLGALLLAAAPPSAGALRAQDEPREQTTLRGDVRPFFAAHCVRCHGEDKQKGDVALHDLTQGPSRGGGLAQWERVLDVLQSGEMPPDDEPQPDEAARRRVARWLAAELDAAPAAAHPPPATTRRLTNLEYHRTLRDLLGVELALTDNLPEDPARPYRANNTAHYLLMGLEHLDRYGENARRAMASVIVDPTPPETSRTRRSWAASEQRGMPDPSAMQPDELGVFGNRNRTVANGMRVFEWPATGAFRIRVRAGAILPPGETELPLRIMLGHDIVGIGASGLDPAGLVGTLRLTGEPAAGQVYELTGRIENFPAKPEHRYRRGGRIDGRLVITPQHFTVTPLNVYDHGALNDRPDPLTLPRAVVEWIEFEAPVYDAWPPAHHTDILFDSPLRATDPDAYVRAVLERFLPRAFRRPVSGDEVARYERIYALVQDELGLETIEQAMRETLATALASPDFLLHETGAADAQHALACRLSYFLWGTMPDAELFDLAGRGELDQPTTIAVQARRMLTDPRAADFVATFCTQWLALDKQRAVPINLERFPRFLHTIARGERRGQEEPNRPTIRAAMKAETIAYVSELIRRNAGVATLIDGDFAMLNRRLAAHYGVAGVHGHELRPVPVRREHHLGGLLTQGAFLVGTSTGTAPHAVYRAVWLREAILGDEVPDPPADVPALEESAGDEVADAVSLKDLLRLHREKESCRDCHARLDPWGVPFERYDATGRYAARVPPPGARVSGFDRARHVDLDGYRAHLEEVATHEVDATSTLPDGTTVDGVADLKRYLIERRLDDVAENVVRRLLAYALGRELTPADRAMVQQLLRSAAPAGYPLEDLIVAICQSEAFAQRSQR